jgi:hypothetical protein
MGDDNENTFCAYDATGRYSFPAVAACPGQFLDKVYITE